MHLVNRRSFVTTMAAAGAGALLGAHAMTARDAYGSESTDSQAAPADASGWAPTATNPDVVPSSPVSAPYIMSEEEIERGLNERAVVTEDWVYEDGTSVEPAYVMVRNTINRSGAGFGSLITKDHQFDLWPTLFTEEEALAYSQMPLYKNFTAAEFAQESGRSEEECLRICNAVADRGLLRRIYEDGVPKFLCLDSEYGYYEAYVQSFTTDYIALKDLNGGSGGNSFLDAEYTLYRALPVSLDVVIDGEYTEWDDWHDIFKRHDKFAVSPCMCRVSTLIREGKASTTQEAMDLFKTMRDCGHPMETCIVTGKQAEWFIEIGAGREITAEEAEAIVQHSVDEGMIVDCLHTKEAENVCSCHTDCCLYVKGIRKLNGGPAVEYASNFQLMHIKEDCIKCGMCADRCPMKAITMDAEGYPIVDSACVRCGQCALVCPKGVRGLKLKPESERHEIPEDLPDYYRRKAHARMGKGWLFDATTPEAMAEKIAEFEQK